MILKKWNYQLHRYESFESPAVVVVLYSEDMTLPVNCANCGKHMTYGDGYTSRTIHNHAGLGYPVCVECYEKEREEEFAS